MSDKGTQVNNNINAFGHREPTPEDMSLRDWFAGQALSGMLACPMQPEGWTQERLAGAAYGFAEAMLAERSK